MTTKPMPDKRDLICLAGLAIITIAFWPIMFWVYVVMAIGEAANQGR